MSKLTSKFSQGKIYKIISTDCNDVYIGSSSVPYLSTRLAIHKYQYKLWLNDNFYYCSSFKLFVYNHPNTCSIELIENYPCRSKKELRKRERYWQEQLPNCINQKKAYMSNKERLQSIKNYQQSPHYRKLKREYYQKNKTILKKNQHAWYLKNRKRIIKCQQEWNKKNKEYRQKYLKKYYRKNKQAKLKYQNEYNKNKK